MPLVTSSRHPGVRPGRPTLRRSSVFRLLSFQAYRKRAFVHQRFVVLVANLPGTPANDSTRTSAVA